MLKISTNLILTNKVYMWDSLLNMTPQKHIAQINEIRIFLEMHYKTAFYRHTH